MANKADELVIYEYANRWVAHHEPAAGTTCVATVAAVPRAQHNCVSLSYSIQNLTAAAVNGTLSIRDGSIGGTVLARWLITQATATASQGTFANIELPGIMSNALVVEFGTPAGSVTQTVAMCGWTENERSG